MNILKDTSVFTVASNTGGATAYTTSSVDTRDCEGVLFMVECDTGNAGNEVTIQHSDDDSTFTALDDTSVVMNPTAKTEIYRPQKQYVRLHVDPTGNNTSVSATFAQKYGLRKKPDTDTDERVAVSPSA